MTTLEFMGGGLVVAFKVSWSLISFHGLGAQNGLWFLSMVSELGMVFGCLAGSLVSQHGQGIWCLL